MRLIGNGDDWNCKKCRPPSRNKIKCSGCKKTIAQNRIPLTCTQCKNYYHASCERISVDSYLKSKEWICNKCICSSLPFEGIDNEKLKITNQGKDIEFGEHLQSHPAFSIQTLLDKFPGSFSCEDFSFDTGVSKYYTPSEFLSSKFKKNGFSILHINIVSLSAHIDELKTLLSFLDHPFDVIGISETKISEHREITTNISIDGYVFEHTPTETHFGGVGLFIKNSVNFNKRLDLSKSLHGISESIFAELSGPNGKQILVGCVYRHPSPPISDFFELFLNDILAKIGNERKKALLLGDFNVDLLKYDSHTGTRDYYDILSANGFRPLIFQPTRVSTTSATLIDNIFINDIETYSNGGNITTSISDHFPQFCLLDIFDNNINQKEVRYGRSYKHFNQNEFDNELRAIDWNQLFFNKSSEESFEIFFQTIERLLDEMAPVRRLTKKEINLLKKPWITTGLLKSMEGRDIDLKKFAAEKDPLIKGQLWERYRIKRNLVKILNRNSKREFYAAFFEENKSNMKRTWEGIRDVVNLNKKNKISITSLNCKGELKSNPKEMTKALNDFFVNIGNMVEAKIPQGNTNYGSYMGERVLNSFFSTPVESDEVLGMIKKLSTNKSCGPNSIPSKILQNHSDILVDPIKMLLNRSLIEGNFPKMLKKADVCPIYKKNDKTKCENYRPISLLSNLSKIYERTMHTRIYNFLETSNALYKFQFGFRKKYSTNHALLSIVEEIRESLDNKTFACGVFIDLEKAFDTVNHSILLGKLEHYGIRGIANDWFKSYLTSREQRVKLNNVTSNYSNITCGVPQGSILGPLLFLLYINDMNKAVKHSIIHHFADDTNLLCKDKNPKMLKIKMNEDLKLIFQWLCANRLSLNVAKTEFIIFKPPRMNLDERFTLRLNGTTLFESTKIKYLGIILDPKLTWKHHIFELRKKLNKSIGIIYKMKNLAPLRVLLSLYYALFHSHLNYGICVWGNAPEQELKHIFLSQKKVIRIITNSDYLANTDPLFKKTGILKLDDIFKLQMSSLMWDFENGTLPQCFSNYFTKVNQSHNHSTRLANSGKYSISERFNTDTHGKTMFKFQGSRLWNSILDLPLYHSNIKKPTFRKKYKIHLISLY